MGKSRVPPTTPEVRSDSPFAVLAGVEVAPGPAVPVAAPKPETGAGAIVPGAGAGALVPGAPRAIGRLVLRRETRHRGGKTVIVVAGLGAIAGFTRDDAEALASRLKRRLGCGGTVEANDGDTGAPRDGDFELVLQGDRLAAVATALRELGYRVAGC